MLTTRDKRLDIIELQRRLSELYHRDQNMAGRFVSHVRTLRTVTKTSEVAGIFARIPKRIGYNDTRYAIKWEYGPA